MIKNYDSPMPNCLIQLRKKNKMPSLFIGAGICRRYIKDYPNWNELLSSLASSCGIGKLEQELILQKIQFQNQDCTPAEQKQKFASIIEHRFIELISNTKNFDKFFNEEEQQEIIENHTSPFKYFIAKQFQNIKIKNDKTYYKTEIEQLKKLKFNARTVITTNYDKFLEDYIFENDFEVFTSQESMYLPSCNGYGEIYKIHGSVDEPNNIILTEEDYQKFDKQNKLTVGKILTILTESPMIFLGYSLTDENVKNILLSLFESLNDKTREIVTKNIIIVQHVNGLKALNESTKYFYCGSSQIAITCIETDNFTKLFRWLSSFQPTARPREIRKFRQMVKEIVDNQYDSIPVALQMLALLKDDDAKNIIAFTQTAIIDNIPNSTQKPIAYNLERGSLPYEKTELLLESLYQTSNYDADQIVNHWYMSPYHSEKFYTGIIYFYNKLDKDKISAEAKEKVKHHFNAIEETKRRLSKKKLPIFDDKQDLQTQVNNTVMSKQYEAIQLALLNKTITKDKVRTFIQKLYEKDNTILNNTGIKKIIEFLELE